MRTKQRVLVVSPYPPTPPFAGGRRRILELVTRLRDVASLTLASIVFNQKDELDLISGLGGSCDLAMARPTQADQPSGLPQAFGWAWSSELAEEIEARHRAERFDVVIAAHSFAFPFVAPLENALKVVDAHNLEYKVHAQFAGLPSAQRDRLRLLSGSGGNGFGDSDLDAMRAFEHAVWAAADAVWCVSSVERLEVASTSGRPTTFLVPNAADPPEGISASDQRVPVVSYAGALNYIPNVDAVIELVEGAMPLVQEAVPEAGLLIAGREPNPELVRYCVKRSAVVLADPVDMFDALAGTVMAVPLRMGGGTRIKILEARSHGLPVVASGVALEGLDFDDDPGLWVADSAETMAQALIERLQSSERVIKARVCPPTWAEAFFPALNEIGVVS
jgi:glycosyltransferase involved in cell wall biosynthesis